MNLKIKLKKTNSSPAVFAIEFLRDDDYMLHYDLVYLNDSNVERTFAQELELDRSYILRISRHENGLYLTNNLVHDSYVIVEEIQIDDFWTIDDQNQWSITTYDNKYKQHLKGKSVTWELSKKLYNNTLFFNGNLDYNIKLPIRGMYFK